MTSPEGKIYKLKRGGPKIDPRGTPQVILDSLETLFSMETMNSLSKR